MLTDRADIHHITGAINYLSFILPKRRTVITIHDLGHYLITLKGIKKKLYGQLFIQGPCQRAQIITTISHFTKRQLLQQFNVKPSKVQVVPNPVHESFQPSAFPENELPVILQIGGGKNKNVEMLIEAVRGLQVKLLLIRPRSEGLIAQMQKYGLQFEFRSSQTMQQVQDAYADCDLVYFASTYEGFGLPVIEGQTVGRPVVISNIDPLLEISNHESALVCDLHPQQIRKAILKILQERQFKEELIARGFVNANRFRPAVIAKQYLGVYDSISN